MTTTFEAVRQRQIASKGRPMTLRRGGTDYALLAFTNVFTAEEIAGTDLRQGDLRVDLLADIGGCPPPPRDPDLLISGSAAYTVLFSNPVYDGATLIGWCCAARGA